MGIDDSTSILGITDQTNFIKEVKAMSDKGLLPLKGLYEDSEKTTLFYKKIFDDFPALIWMAGTDGLCWYFNKNWLDFRGRTLEEESGNGWTEGVHKEDFEHCLEVYLTHFNKQESFQWNID
jgi:PAS domain-containing protein